MNQRQAHNQTGATLLMVASAILVIIIIGIGFFLLCKILGGQRELQFATNAGGLNVAKQAIETPTVQLKPGTEFDNFGTLGDPNQNGDINLLTFNRLVAQTMLVALNANQDPGPGDLGVKHAQQLIDAVEGKGSVGERLAQRLSVAQGSLTSGFSELASSNSTRMIAKDGSTQVQDFKTAFVEQRTDESGACNIRIPPALSSLVPTALQTQVGSDTYLRGYSVSSLPNSMQISGVPIPPTEAPHLISEKTFEEEASKPPTLGSLALPPNAFRVAAQAQNAVAGAPSRGAACSEVAALSRQFDMSLPYGYIAVYNGPSNGPGSAFVRGPFGNINNVLNHELLSPGVFISGNIFTTDLPLLDEWAAYNKAIAEGQKPSSPPSMKNLFTLTGDDATPQDAASVKYTPTGEADYLQCVDTNTNGNDPSSVCPKCHDLWQNGSFDNAFANRPTNSASDPILCSPACPCRDSGNCQCLPHKDKRIPSSCRAKGCFCSAGECCQGQAGDLMADEFCKMQLIKLFWKKGDISSAGCPVTGLRKFDRNKELPWNRNGPIGVVSKEVGVSDLIEFVSDESADKVLKGSRPNDPRSFYGRIRQIKPEATDKEIAAVLGSKPLKLGDRLYIYMKDPVKDRTLMFDAGPPPGMKGPVSIDGNPYPKAYSKSYPLVGTFVNPHYDNGISYLMYLEGPDKEDMVGTDTAVWKPCSGYNNFLGLLQFTNSASGEATGWNKPN